MLPLYLFSIHKETIRNYANGFVLNAHLNKTLLTDTVGHGTGGLTTAVLLLVTNAGAEVGGSYACRNIKWNIFIIITVDVSFTKVGMLIPLKYGKPACMPLLKKCR